MQFEECWRRSLREHEETLGRLLQSTPGPLQQLALACAGALEAGRKLLFFGNGGSAADAQHLATELTVRYRLERPAMRAVALTTDTSTLTAIGNDFGFDDLFARQVEALCAAGDVAIGLSTSGNSENVIRGVIAARARGALTAAFTGGAGGRLLHEVDHAIVVPSESTARIQEMHIVLGHVLCEFLESAAVRSR